MYAVNNHDTGCIGIHGGVDVRTYVRMYGTVDDIMGIKPRWVTIFFNNGAPCASAFSGRGAPL